MGKNKPKSPAAPYLSPERIRIATLNAWGLRTHGKKEDLKSFLRDFRVHIAVTTETHLLRKETRKLSFTGFTVIDGAGYFTKKGEVVFLARVGIYCWAAPESMILRLGDA